MSEYTGTMTPQEWWDAVERSDMDLTLCRRCNAPIIVIPDGMIAECKQCYESDSK